MATIGLDKLYYAKSQKMIMGMKPMVHLFN